MNRFPIISRALKSPVRSMVITAAIWVAMLGGADMARASFQVYIPSYNNATPGILGTNGGRVVGQSFTATTSVTLNSLGFIDLNNTNPVGGGSSDGLLGSYQVGIWNATTEQLLASTTVTTDSTLINGFRYSPIPATTLSAGEHFVIGALLPANLQDYYLINTVSVDSSQFSGPGFPSVQLGVTSLVFPTGSSPDMGGEAVGIVNASDAIVAPVPEPTSVALVSLGGLALFWRRRAKNV